MQAVILAGGLGTRLQRAVPELPKPMAPVAGRPFLEHLLSFWVAQGVSRVILAVGYRYEAIRDHFGARYQGCEIAYAVEERLLGTGGALLAAWPLLHESRCCLVLNGDTYFAVPLAPFLRNHEASGADVSMALFRTPDTGRYARVDLDGGGNVKSLGGSAGPGAGFANGGVFLFNRGSLAGRGPPARGTLGLEQDLIASMIGEGRTVAGYPSDVAFVDIGVPEDWRRAEGVINNQRKERD